MKVIMSCFSVKETSIAPTQRDDYLVGPRRVVKNEQCTRIALFIILYKCIKLFDFKLNLHGESLISMMWHALPLRVEETASVCVS